jgi:hypothetical protein
MNQSLFKRPLFWYGIYYGIASIVMFTVVYAVDINLFGHFLMMILATLAIMATFMVLGGLAERKLNGGYLTYGKAFFNLFLIGVIGSFIYMLFNILFINLIDKEFLGNLAEVMKESTMKFMQSFGEIPEEKIDKAMADMDKQFANANSFASYARQFLLNSTPMALIMALICALFVKKKTPEGVIESTNLDTPE